MQISIDVFSRVLHSAILICAILLVSIPAHAVEPSRLYEGEVLVADTSDELRADAERGALQAVLVKLTGRKNVLVSDVLGDPRTPAGAYIQQFQYRGGSTADGSDPLRFWAKFDSAAIDTLLAESGVAVWPRTRPLTAVVLGLDKGGVRSVLAADDTSSLIASIRTSADARGLPIVLPLMDLRDRVAVGPQDLWGGFEDRIGAAANRYGAEAILYGAVTAVGPGALDATWTLLLAGQGGSWTESAIDGGLLGQAMVDSVADRFVSIFATTSSGGASERVSIIVEGIESAAAYGLTLAYLRRLDIVQSIHVLSVGSGRATIELEAQGGVSTLARLISIGNVMRSTGTGDDTHFRLLQ